MPSDCRIEPLDDSENPLVACRTGMVRNALFWRRYGDLTSMQPATALGKFDLAAAIGQPAEVPDLDEPGGQDVLQETSQELHGSDRHYFALAIAVIPPPETDVPIEKGKHPGVGDGDAVGISG